VLVSDLAGKSNVEYKAKELGVDLGANGCDSKTIVNRDQGDGRRGLPVRRGRRLLQDHGGKIHRAVQAAVRPGIFRVTIEKDKDLPCTAHATIKISVDDRHEITAAEGLGPVSALDNALRKALGRFYPDLDTMRLVDFKVRVIDGRDGTAAKVRGSHRVPRPRPDLEHHRGLRRHHRGQLAGPGRQFSVQTAQRPARRKTGTWPAPLEPGAGR
jgi:2-isopropylmalate synthase